MIKKCVTILILIALLASLGCLAVFAAKSAQRNDAQIIIRNNTYYMSLYDIEGYKCIMLRDIAQIMGDTDKHFGIEWDSNKKTLNIITGLEYEGSELKKAGSLYPKYKKKSERLYVNDMLSSYCVYDIEGRNYVRIRDIAEIIGCSIVWNAESQELYINKNVETIHDMTSDISDIRTLSQLFEGDYVSYLNEKCGEKIDIDSFSVYDDGFDIKTENDVYSFKYSDMQDFVRFEIVNYFVIKMIETEDDILSDESSESITETDTETTTEIVQEIDKSKPIIALTFDDGPRAGSTDRILSVLKQYGARATFFVVGQNVEKHPELVKAAVEQGCQIGNHSYSHINLNKASDYTVKTEIAKTSNAVYDAAGVYTYIGRPPYGSVNPNVRKAANIEWFNWSVDTLDWKYKDKNYVANAVINNAQDGAVILLHDLQTTTADAMEIAIPKLVDMGYQLVTIGEMAELYGTENVKGYIKPDRVIK